MASKSLLLVEALEISAVVPKPGIVDIVISLTLLQGSAGAVVYVPM